MRRVIISLIALVCIAAVVVWIAAHRAPHSELAESSSTITLVETIESQTEPAEVTATAVSPQVEIAATVPEQFSASAETAVIFSNPPTTSQGQAWEARIQAHVADEHGNPIAEAMVTVESDQSTLGETAALDQTDFEGRCELAVPSFHWGDLDEIRLRVIGRAHGFGPGMQHISVSREEPIAAVNLTLNPGSTLAGRVQWQSGEPVPNAGLIIYGDTFGEGRTDALGLFRIEGLAEGRALVSVSPHGGPYQYGGAHVVGDEDVVITLKPRIGVVTGQVMGGVSREPRPGLTVQLGDNVSGYDAWATVSDAEGRFRFEEIPLESWVLQGPDLPGVRESVRLTEEIPEVDITLSIPEAFDVSGTVYDVDTGDPVPDFPISITGLNAHDNELGPSVSGRTDANGRFTLGGVMIAGSQGGSSGFHIIARCDEAPWTFVQGQRELEMVFSSLRDLEDLELEVRQGSPLEVTVVDPSGNPIPRAHMILCLGARSSLGIGETNAVGRLTIIRPPDLEVCQIIGSAAQWPVLVSPLVHPEQTEVRIEAMATTALRVSVVDQEGEPVPNAVIVGTPQLEISGPPTVEQHFRLPRGDTNQAGQCDMQPMPRCLVTLRTTAVIEEGAERQIADERIVDLGSDDAPTEITIQIELEKSDREITLRGHVVNPDDEPMVGVPVYVRRGESERGESTFTNGDGRFEITGPESLLLSVWTFICAEAPGHQQGCWRAQNDGTWTGEIEITLYPIFTIRGQAVRADGTPLPQGDLYLAQPSTNTRDEGWQIIGGDFSRDGQWIGEGRFEFVRQYSAHEAWPRPVWLMIMTGDGLVGTADLTLDPGVQTEYDVGVVTLEPGLMLEGRVINTTGEPIQGAQIHWESASFAQGQYTLSAWQDSTSVSGQYRLHPLPPGHWRFEVTAAGYHAETFEIDLQSSLERDFVLTSTEGVTVTVHFVTSEGNPIPGTTSDLRNDELGIVSTLQTDSQGEAHHLGVPPGEYTHTLVWISSPTVQFMQQIEVGQEDVIEVIDLGTWHELSVRCMRDDAPMAHTWVAVFSSETGGSSFSSGRHADFAGHASFPVPTGRYTIDCQGRQEQVEVTADREVEITLPAIVPE